MSGSKECFHLNLISNYFASEQPNSLKSDLYFKQIIICKDLYFWMNLCEDHLIYRKN